MDEHFLKRSYKCSQYFRCAYYMVVQYFENEILTNRYTWAMEIIIYKFCYQCTTRTTNVRLDPLVQWIYMTSNCTINVQHSNMVFNPLTPKISLVFLLTVCQMIIDSLFSWRIWYWIN